MQNSNWRFKRSEIYPDGFFKLVYVDSDGNNKELLGHRALQAHIWQSVPECVQKDAEYRVKTLIQNF